MPERWIVILDVRREPNEKEPHLWDWDSLVDGADVHVVGGKMIHEEPDDA